MINCLTTNSIVMNISYLYFCETWCYLAKLYVSDEVLFILHI